MNATTAYESACSYDSDESTVETEKATIDNKKTQEDDHQTLFFTSCGAKNLFLPATKVPEDIFPPHGSSSMVAGVQTSEDISEDQYTDYDEKVVDNNGYEVIDALLEHQNTFGPIDTKNWYVACQQVDAEQFIINQGKKSPTALRKLVTMPYITTCNDAIMLKTLGKIQKKTQDEKS
jgi:hypothetical protein